MGPALAGRPRRLTKALRAVFRRCDRPYGNQRRTMSHRLRQNPAHRLATTTNCASPASLAIGRNALSVTLLGGVPGGRSLIHAWISGCSLSSARMDPTRIGETPSLAAMAARLLTSPLSSSRCHASAWASSKVTGGGSVSTGFGGFLVP